MSGRVTLVQTGLREGVWEGILSGHTGPEQPRLRAFHMDRALSGLDVCASATGEGCYAVTLNIPIQSLSEGVQAFSIQDEDSGERLAEFAIISGNPAAETLEAEVALLRAEVDMLKKVVRRLSRDEA